MFTKIFDFMIWDVVAVVYVVDKIENRVDG
jgi:hypothetical protein